MASDAARADDSRRSSDFLAHLQVERRMSAHTLDAYRRDLDALAAWAAAQGVDDLVALHAEQLRAFIAAEHRRGLSPKSLQRRLSACRSFYRWLLKHGRIAASPAAGDPRAEGAAQAAAGARSRRGQGAWSKCRPTRRWACATARCWNCSIPPACA